MSFEEQVRERAYHIWLAGGMADGCADEHWVCAERAVRDESGSAEVVVILTKAATKPRKAVASKPATKAKPAKTTVKSTAKPRAAKAARAGMDNVTTH